jgi:vitamin-K-epoxide reductase (warfarin-sensitive)
MEPAIVVLSGIGLLLSLYALYVKRALANNKNYHALCDISEQVSCTKTIGSRYGSLFLIPNSAFGIVFYGMMMLLGAFDEMRAVFWLSLLAVIGSVYLAYVSLFKLRIVCPVCVAVYALNAALVFLAF